jgi:hypothetical protein
MRPIPDNVDRCPYCNAVVRLKSNDTGFAWSALRSSPFARAERFSSLPYVLLAIFFGLCFGLGVVEFFKSFIDPDDSAGDFLRGGIAILIGVAGLTSTAHNYVQARRRQHADRL